MDRYATEAIRSIALVGHGGAGKTTLAEALLHAVGAIAARGAVEKGNTVCDFDAQEKSAGHSLNSALVNFAWEDVHLHLIDTPGYPDFSGPALAALAGVDTALVVVNAQTGIELATERMMRAAAARNLARMIVINKIDADNLDLPGLVAELRERFGRQCMLLDLPAHDRHDVVEVLEHDSGDADFDSVQQAHRALIDQLVEEDEDLLARYLEEGADPNAGELHAPFEKALREGHLVPILFVSAKTGAGLPQLLHALAALAPNPAEGNPPPFYRGEPGTAGEPFSAVPQPDRHVLAHVFKMVADPYMGNVAIFRVHQGTLRRDSQLFAGDGRKPFRIGHLYQLQGKDYVEVDELLPGDLGAIAKVEDIVFDCVLHDSHDEDHIHLKPLEFPQPMQGLAVETRRKGDEQRLFDTLNKLVLEDPCFEIERHPTTHETVIRGLGEMHLRYKLERLASQYKLELDTRPPQIPYRETVTAPAEGHHRHKKQSGGAGQFGEVYLRLEPLARGAGFEFVDQVKGGVIPGVFIPSVEKGVRQALADGVIAGFPVTDLRVIVYDGKSHPVDGKDVAFFSAGRKAALAAIRAAHPIVLEPIVAIEVATPESAMGDIAGDLSSRRGHVTGTQPRGYGNVALSGEVPLAEIADYASRLKSLTGGKGSYSIDLARYAAVPPQTQKKLSDSFRPQEVEE
ncbi:Translation elongation factor G-related protein [Georgfuchsia toluolica]|uniref:Elongation factor G n=1 Tax=Georgfuchsia toluolica TaxID=424218 RepID=A0A916J5B7_9PROT|nr:elongation factor G [Georgfuchsia toluolica]CAG4884489.1 Translation elongation factor G-related protein [Georgfuchsia toluolica]